MLYRASHRYADMSARKVRPFAALIRNLPVDEAPERLQFLPNKSARLLEAVLKSARRQCGRQGRTQRRGFGGGRVRVDDGPFMKRIQPRARRHRLPDQTPLFAHSRCLMGRRGGRGGNRLIEANDCPESRLRLSDER